MMKALIKYSISLVILLLAVYSQLPAQAKKESVLYSTIRNIASSEYANVCAALHYQLIVKSSPSGEKRENYQIDAAENEVEEYEVISSKKNVDSGNYAIAIIFQQGINYFFSAGNKTSPFLRYSSYTSSFRYLAFQSFRI